MRNIKWLLIGIFIVRAVSAAPNYAIMIDAGSTGTRVFVYEYENYKNQKMPRIKLLGVKKIEPGLSRLHSKPGAIKGYLKPLLAFAKANMPKNQNYSEVLLKLQATGGVRALKKSKQERLINWVDQELNKMNFKSPKAEIISGATEGVYEWISVNYLRGYFKNKNKKSVGIIEMGGASVQVSFLDKKLYVKSYDGLGETSAWNRFGQAQCKEIPLDYKTCRRSLRSNINSKINSIEKKNLEGDSYLIDNFVEVAMVIKKDKLSINILDTEGPRICSWPLRKLKKKMPDRTEKYLKKICFDTAYMSVTLEKLGFARNHKLNAVKEINDTTITWTLGSLIKHLKPNAL